MKKYNVLVTIQLMFCLYLLHVKLKEIRKRDKSNIDFKSCLSPLYGFSNF